MAAIRAQVEALQSVGLTDLAANVDKGLKLFEDYHEPAEATTWSDVVAQYDPEGTLEALDAEISALDNYGLGA